MRFILQLKGSLTTKSLRATDLDDVQGDLWHMLHQNIQGLNKNL